MHFPFRRPNQRGFTLLELVVVIGMIAFITVFIGFTFSNGKGQYLEAGRRIAANMVRAARTQAVLHPSTDSNADAVASAWFLIHDDPSDTERYRRYLGIIYYQATTGGWVAGNQGILLPKGIYVRETSDIAGHTSGRRIYLNYPRAIPDTDLDKGGDRWTGYGFSPSGTFMHNGAHILLGVGRYVPETHSWKSRNPYAQAGFAIWRSGGLSPVMPIR